MGPTTARWLTVILLSLVSPPLHAQMAGHDPDLLDKLYRGDFDAVGRSQQALGDVMMVIMGAADAGCSVESTAPEVEDAAQKYENMMMYLARHRQDLIMTWSAMALSLRTPNPHPNAARIRSLIAAHGCGSELVQRHMVNLLRVFAVRPGMGDWAPAVAPSERPHSPPAAADGSCPLTFASESLTIRQGATASVAVSGVHPEILSITLSFSSPAAGLSVTATPNPIVRRADFSSLNVFVAPDTPIGVHPLVVACDEERVGDRERSATTLMVTVAGEAAGARWSHVSVGHAHSCGLNEEGTAYCWGSNQRGELGIGVYGAAGTRHTPVPVDGSFRFASLSAGEGEFTCGITVRGEAYCWGHGYQGQLGTGRLGRVVTPAAVAGRHTWRHISAGSQHTCGITTAGEAYCWGANIQGALGTDGRSSQRAALEPALVSGGHRWLDIAAGGQFTCGVTTAHELFCWGSNLFGRLGIPAGESQRAPVRVAAGQRWTSVSVSMHHACAITTDGEAYCWGRNHQGELGIGNTTERAEPSRVAGGHRWASVATADGRSCGITQGGQAYCWGGGYAGVGGQRPAVHAEPVAVQGGFTWASLDVARQHTCGIVSSGATYCWGRGAIGSEQQGTFPIPTRVRDP